MVILSMKMNSYYYVDSAGRTQGPYTVQQLAEMARIGVITDNTMVAADGDPAWKPFGSLGAAKPPNPVLTILRKANHAFAQFALDPVGGLPGACHGLDKSSAIAVGVTFCAFYVLCNCFFAHQCLPKEAFAQIPTLNLVISSAVPFLALAAANFLTRLLFRGSGNPGCDFFLAGAVLLPAAVLLAVVGIVGILNIEVVLAASVFAVCLTILMLYAGCHRIYELSERSATIAVPVMLVASAWLIKIVYVSWIGNAIKDAADQLWPHFPK